MACICALPYPTCGQGTTPSVKRQIYPGPSEEYLTQLLEFECGEVGTGLEIVKDSDAVSGAYLTATEVFPDAPPTNPANYVRIAVDTLANYAFEGFFRVRNPTADSASIWARLDDRDWKRLTFPPDTAWTWQQGGTSYQEYFYVGSLENSTATVDIAFATAGLQLDQLFLDNTDAEGLNYYVRPFNYKIKGTNCPDFVNLPPVAGIEPGRELYAMEYYISAAGSYDPNDIIACYDHQYVRERDKCQYRGDMVIPLGDNSISVVVRDYYGAEDTASTIFRGVPFSYTLSERTAYRLEGECGATGGYWTAEADADRYNGSLAVGGAAASYTSSPADIPENQLRFTIPAVAAADTGRYYLAGVFRSSIEEGGDCVWVRINGEEWHNWSIISPERSFYPGPPFDLVEGDNTLELAYCSPGLGVDRLFVSPDTGYPNILTRGGTTIEVGCDGEPGVAEYWLEAECGTVGTEWEILPNREASGDGYVVKREGSNYSVPTGDEPAGYVRFTVNILSSGTHQLQARIKAPDLLSDSYYVRVNGGEWQTWRSGIRRGVGFAWNLFPGGGIDLGIGANTIDFAYREAGTQLDRIYLGSATTPLSGKGEQVNFSERCRPLQSQYVGLVLQAQCASYGAAWSPRSGPEALSGAYLVPLEDNSLAAPPAEVPANIVEFEFDLATTPLIDGQLTLYASTGAPSGDDDSFWVKVNDGAWYAWKSLKRSGQGFTWNRLPFPLRNLRLGETNTVQFAYRESGTKLDMIYLTTEDTLRDDLYIPFNCPYEYEEGEELLLREAECRLFDDGWTTVQSELASNNYYTVFTGERQLSAPTGFDSTQIQEYYIETSNRGDFRLFLRMDAPDVTRNSVWVQVDDGPWVRMWQEVGGAQLLTEGFEWREVNEDGIPVRFYLTSADQVLRIANREPGTKIDKIYFSKVAEPFGFAPIARYCSPPFANLYHPTVGLPASQHSEAPITQPHTFTLYPNPVAAGTLTLDLASAYTGRVEVLVYDGQGRRVLHLPFEKDGAQWQTQLEVTELPPGVYRIQLLEGDRQTTKSFVRR